MPNRDDTIGTMKREHLELYAAFLEAMINWASVRFAVVSEDEEDWKTWRKRVDETLHVRKDWTDIQRQAIFDSLRSRGHHQTTQ